MFAARHRAVLAASRHLGTRAKLEPSRIRSTLAFAGLFQLTHEMIKRSVLDDVKGFYGFSNAKGRSVWLLGRDGQ